MQRKYACFCVILSILLVGCMLTGCASLKSAIAGNWYDDQGEGYITFYNDGTFSDKDGGIGGTYAIDGSNLVLTYDALGGFAFTFEATISKGVLTLTHTETDASVTLYKKKPDASK